MNKDTWIFGGFCFMFGLITCFLGLLGLALYWGIN
jgi:hypothetical protein